MSFHDPLPLRCDVLDTCDVLDKISSAHMYALLTSPKEGILETLVKDVSLPILAITGKLYSEIRYLTELNAQSEYAIFLILKRLDANKPHFLAFDFFMPTQKASAGGVDLTGSDCDQYFARLAEVPYYKEHGLHRHLCHLHSHAQMGVFWSSVDDTQQLTRDDLGFMDDYRFYCVVNVAGKIKCSFVTYKPVLQRIDAAVVLAFTRPEYITALTKERKEELKALVQDCIIPNVSLQLENKLFPVVAKQNTSQSGYWDFPSKTNHVTAEISYDPILAIDGLYSDLQTILTQFVVPKLSLYSPEIVSNFEQALGFGEDIDEISHQKAEAILQWLWKTLNVSQCPELETVSKILGEYVHLILVAQGWGEPSNFAVGYDLPAELPSQAVLESANELWRAGASIKQFCNSVSEDMNLLRKFLTESITD